MGLSQFALEFEKTLHGIADASAMSLEVALISASGDVIQRVAQQVKNTGVLTDTSVSAAESEEMSGRSLSMTGDFPDHDAVLAPKAPKKGLLTRLFGGLGNDSDSQA
jgi:hypothetical protein